MSPSQQFLVIVVIAVIFTLSTKEENLMQQQYEKIEKLNKFFTKYPKAVLREAKIEIPIDASLSTIKRRVRVYDLRSSRCTKKSYASEKNRKVCIKFAKTHLNWNKQQLKNVLWSDESHT